VRFFAEINRTCQCSSQALPSLLRFLFTATQLFNGRKTVSLHLSLLLNDFPPTAYLSLFFLFILSTVEILNTFPMANLYLLLTLLERRSLTLSSITFSFLSFILKC